MGSVETKKRTEKYDYLVLKSNIEGKAIQGAKELFEVTKKTEGNNVRLDPKHPNVIEVKDKKTGKWLPLTVFIDPKNTYTPKGKNENLVKL